MTLRKKYRRQMNCISVSAKEKKQKCRQQKFSMMNKCNKLKHQKDVQHSTNNIISAIFNSIIYKFKKIDITSKEFISTVFLLLSILQLPVAFGACREEPSRDCESICSDKANTTAIGSPGYYGNNCVIRAVVLLPNDNSHVAALHRVLPVLKVAEEQIREHQLLPHNVRFEWLPKDDKCDAAYAVIKAMDGAVKSCGHVLFGPVCDYALAAVSRLTKYFNSEGTPLITVGGFTYDFEMPKTNCNNEFYMLLRTGMLSFETMSHLTVNVMKRNKWSRSVFFYDRDGQRNVGGEHTCFLMLNTLGKLMRKENMIFDQYQLNMKITNRTEEMKREIGNNNAK